MSDLADIPRGAKLNRITSVHVRSWNEAARAELGRLFDSESDAPGGAKSATVIDILNNTGATVEQFEILRLTDAAITYAQNELSFRNNWCIKAETPREPTELDPIVVVRNSLPSGRIGKATIAGVTPAQILVGTGEESWRFVETIDGDRTKFAIAKNCGIGQIIWKETGTGTKWALVELAGAAARTSQPAWTVTDVKTLAYTAAAYEIVRYNVSAGGFTINFPASPTVGHPVRFVSTETHGGGGGNLLTLDGNGENIQGSASTLSLSNANNGYAGREFVFVDGTTGWAPFPIIT